MKRLIIRTTDDLKGLIMKSKPDGNFTIAEVDMFVVYGCAVDETHPVQCIS